jgi:hypothetical protein
MDDDDEERSDADERRRAQGRAGSSDRVDRSTSGLMFLALDMLRAIDGAFLGFVHARSMFEVAAKSKELLRDPSLHTIQGLLRSPFCLLRWLLHFNEP